MKFGKRLEDDLIHPGWERYMIPYAILKEIINIIVDKDEKSLSMLASLCSSQHRDSKTKLKHCNESTSSAASISSTTHVANGEEEFLVVLLRSKMAAKEFIASHHELLDSHCDDVLNDILNIPIKKVLDLQQQSIISKFVTWLEETQALRQFALTCQVAVKKIIKKYMKKVPSLSANAKIRNRIAEEMEWTIEPSDEQLSELVKRGLDAIHSVRIRDTLQFDMIKDLQLSYSVWIEKQIQKRTEHLDRARDQTRRRNGGERGRSSSPSRFLSNSAYAPYRFSSLKRNSSSQLVNSKKTIIAKTTVTSTSAISLKIPMVYDVLKPEIGLLVAVFLPVVTFAVTYKKTTTIYIDPEKRRTLFDKKGYYLSSSFDQAPASCYAAQGLSLTVFCLAIVILIQHKIVQSKLRGKWGKFHRLSLASGLFGCWAAVGVASWQHQHSAITHNTYAVLFFISGVAHITMETFIDKSFDLSPPRTIWIRIFISSLTIMCCFGFLYFGYQASYTPFAIETGENDPVQLLISAISEIVMFLGFISFFGTYFYPFLQYEIELKVMPRKVFDIRSLEEPRTLDI